MKPKTMPPLFRLTYGLENTILAAEAGLHSAVFDNGVKLVVEEDHSVPVAMVQIWLKVGGRDEVPGKTGLAHVFEHMMFKGSEKLGAGEFSRRIATPVVRAVHCINLSQCDISVRLVYINGASIWRSRERSGRVVQCSPTPDARFPPENQSSTA